MDALLTGPMSDKLFEMIEPEIKPTIDQQTGIAKPFVAIAVGGRKYQEMKKRIAEMVIQAMPEAGAGVEEYATRALDIEATIAERMALMSSEQYEELLRPA